MKYIQRLLNIKPLLETKSLFLFGPRQTGKTVLLKQSFPQARFINLLEWDTYLQFSGDPSLFRKQLQSYQDPYVVVDEIQRLPDLLNEVHNLIESQQLKFILTGSSARALRKQGVNLLGGRARARHLHPFVSGEIEKFDLDKALNYGLIPSIYLSDRPLEDLASYVGEYLHNEILAEGTVRNVPSFSRFLTVAAQCNASILNYAKIAADAQVARSTVQEYFSILLDTLIGYEIHPYKSMPTRKVVSGSKFYFFDVGVVRYLLRRGPLYAKTPDFGAAFETFIFHELKTFHDYHFYSGLSSQSEITFWKTHTGQEVDFIFKDDFAVEVKSVTKITNQDVKGLKAFQKDHALKSYHVVCFAPISYKLESGIFVWHWSEFLKKLWQGSFL